MNLRYALEDFGMKIAMGVTAELVKNPEKLLKGIAESSADDTRDQLQDIVNTVLDEYLGGKE